MHIKPSVQSVTIGMFAYDGSHYGRTSFVHDFTDNYTKVKYIGGTANQAPITMQYYTSVSASNPIAVTMTLNHEYDIPNYALKEERSGYYVGLMFLSQQTSGSYGGSWGYITFS